MGDGRLTRATDRNRGGAVRWLLVLGLTGGAVASGGRWTSAEMEPPSEPATPAPIFAYSPRVVAPGGSVAVSAARFDANSVAALVVTSASGEHTSLGVISTGAGSFTRTFVVPMTLAPGRYMIFMTDSRQQFAINLVGSITIVPPGRAWFSYRPAVAAPGAGVTVTAGGLGSGVAAAVALVDAASQGTTLGFAAVRGGGFKQTFSLPAAGLADGMYAPIVRDAFQPTFAINTDGPLAVTTVPAPLAIPVGSYPIGAAVNAGTGRVYVPNGGDNTVSVLDATTNTEVAVVPAGALPCAVAVHPGTDRVYVANLNSNDVTVIDGRSNSVIATVPVGSHPCAVGVLPAMDRVFIGNYGSDSVTVVDGTAAAEIATVAVGRGPFGIATNPVTGLVYVVNGFDNTVSVLDGTSLSVSANIGVGSLPDAVGVNPKTNRVYVANYFGNSVTLINGSTNGVLGTIPVGKEPDAVGVDWVADRVYVSNYSSNTVSVLDGSRGSLIATIPVGAVPDGLAVNPRTGAVYVSNSNSNSVSVIDGP